MKGQGMIGAKLDQMGWCEIKPAITFGSNCHRRRNQSDIVDDAQDARRLLK
jgi:hypothetical protein